MPHADICRIGCEVKRGGKRNVPRVTPVELTNALTGYRTTFPTMGMADDYLNQCHGYIRKHLMCNIPITNRHGTKYTVKILPTQKIPASGQPSYPKQICWDCNKACGGCRWSREFKPIPGWTATYVPNRPQNPATYSITGCPEFMEG